MEPAIVAGMGKHPRPNLPGVAFHLTTRLQGHAHLLTPRIRNGCVGLLRRQALRSDARLLAYVFMTNHLHLVVIQGARPLGNFMQPLLRSIAWLVQTVHGVEGHVFERRYRHRVCWDRNHLQHAIAYTHANPVRAGLCTAPGDYGWSSHRLYESASGAGRRVPPIDVRSGLELFAPREADWRSAGRSAYVSFLGGILPPDPGTSIDSLDDSVAEVTSRLAVPLAARAPDDRVPLEDLAMEVLGCGPSTNPLIVRSLKSRRGPRSRLRRRSQFAHAAARTGYTNGEIAGFLEVSDATVSRILAGPP